MKKITVLREMADPLNDMKFISIKLPIKRETKTHPYRGVIEIPKHDYQRDRKALAESHWYRINEVVQVSKIMASKSYSFHSYKFLQTKDLRTPMELSDLHKIQKSHHNTVKQQIQIHWREYIISETQDKMADKYNFFAIETEEYLKGELHSILRRMDLFISHHIRTFAMESAKCWIDFIKSFRAPKEPLVILHLAVVKKKGIPNELEASDKKKKKTLPNLPPHIDFYPSIEKMHKFFVGGIQTIGASTNEINKLEFDLTPFMNIKKRPSFKVYESDAWLHDSQAEISRILDYYLGVPKQILNKFKEYEWIVQLEIERHIDTLFSEEPNTDEIHSLLQNVQESMLNVETLNNDTVNLRFFQLECAGLKSQICKKGKEIMSAVTKRVAEYATEKIHDVLKEYESVEKRLETVPQNEVELFELKQFYKEIPKIKQRLHNDTQTVRKHLDVLDDFNVIFDEKEMGGFYYTLRWPINIDISYREGELKLEDEEEKFKAKLDKDRDRWYRNLHNLVHDFETVQHYSDYSQVETNHDAVMKLNEQLIQSNEEIKSINDREKQFEIAPSDSTELQKTMTGFEPFRELWKNVYDFKNNHQRWLNEMLVTTINAQQVIALTDQWYSDCFILQKKLSDKSPEALNVISHLKDEIEKFKICIPLIRALSNEAFKESHWNELSVIAQREEPLNPAEETVSTLIEKGIDQHIELIEDLSDRAQREYRLESKLKAMKKEWEDKEVPILAFKDTHIIQSVDEIQVLLDDQIVTAQAMKTSRYVKPIEAECRDWVNKLTNIQDVIEEWAKCQRQWMYLEPIFTSEDIKRDLPNAYWGFQIVDQEWHKIMSNTVDDNKVMECIAPDGSTLKQLEDCNIKLDEITSKLNEYLERKREAFPRFYFIADDALLDILSTTKDPLKVQDHLNKCFEAVDRVHFTEKQEITKVISMENEEVILLEEIDVNEGGRKGNVEIWMTDLETEIFRSMKEICKRSVKQYTQVPRTDWVKNWPGQIVLAVSQIFWTQDVEQVLHEGKKRNMMLLSDKLASQINDIVKMVRGPLTKLQRITLGALTVIDVHARDTVTDLIAKGINEIQAFDWIAQLRYYWQEQARDVKLDVKMVNACLKYNFEYLGNTARLVITPLTDRCYRTLMGAYHLCYGGAPEGPAGTGKTESTKDLARAVAVKCVVFNCSDGLDFRRMAQFFKGLSSSGCWCCFDEFNRIHPEVLSVIAMQVLTIQLALRAGKKFFDFDETSVQLVPTLAINITMNPGYAGRSELPDNLKALFRPCAMMIPNYSLIAEITLLSYGFEDARNLAQKCVASLQLSSEQLSTQDHYDFGMRAVKSILTACGRLRMKYPDDHENIVVLRALSDANVPKFTSNDIPLFMGIIRDLFPGVVVPNLDYGSLKGALEEACSSLEIQPKAQFQHKCIQLYETLMVRHGLMLVGETFSGKTKTIQTLQLAINSLKDGEEFTQTHLKCLNPKSITLTQLYGDMNPMTDEWSDGILAQVVKEFAANKTTERKWVLFDGPVDALWIENMNTVLDDNKMLCLSSGEIIKLSEGMTMMFEVENLRAASPATVSRCGMVYIEPIVLGWEVQVQTFIQKLPSFMYKYAGDFEGLLLQLLHPAIEFARKKCTLPVPVTPNELAFTTLQILLCFVNSWIVEEDIDVMDSPLMEEKSSVSLPKDFDEQLKNYVFFSVIWAVGGTVDENSRQGFSDFFFKLINGENVKREYSLIDIPHDWRANNLNHKIPSENNCFDYVYGKRKDYFEWLVWSQLQSERYEPPKQAEFHEIIVPTKDSIQQNYLLEFLGRCNLHVLFSGLTGTGKTIQILNSMRSKFYNDQWTYMYIAFSAQTDANKIQYMMEGQLEKRQKRVYAPPAQKKMFVFIDDLNMPQKEFYGAQPPIELLRQWMDYNGWYDLETKEFRRSNDIQFVAAMGPPSGGRNHVTQRYMRHYNKFYMTPFDTESMSQIFTSIVRWFFGRSEEGFGRSVTILQDNVVTATIELFQKVSAEMLPTPVKMHYSYNLRDVGKVFQGIAQGDPLSVKDDFGFIKLWAHECQRVFKDRMISLEDGERFDKLLKDTMQANFNREWSKVVQVEPLLYSSFVPMISPGEGKPKINDLYCELTDRDLLKETILEQLDFHNKTRPDKMFLVMFMQAIEHVIRIFRIINFAYGNALLIGVGGSGRKLLTKLAAFISQYSVFQIEISRGYGMDDWHKDLRETMRHTGIDNKPGVFLFEDTQIILESFLEDINNLLNNGDVPGLYDAEGLNEINEAMQEVAIAQRKSCTPAELYSLFVSRCRENLHLVISFSPVGEDFRRRLRMFPSLVNCTTIDWFLAWPQDALLDVAQSQFKDVDVPAELKDGIIDICVDMQTRGEELASKFYHELRRHFYITPTSYLELLALFTELVKEKRVSTKSLITRYSNGLQKLQDTGEAVSQMQVDLEELQPKLAQAQKDTAAMEEDLIRQREEAEEARKE